jgi:L-ascorbate metabolism protein UlaG (beta-lactamase superfamily)
MIITYHSGAFIKIVSGDLTVAFNPISKESKLKETKFGSDLAFISMNHPDVNGMDTVTRSGKELFTIDGPGEYESKGVFAKGVATESMHGVADKGTPKINTIFSLHLEDIHIVHLGLLSTETLTGKMLDSIDNVDILFVPVGGEGMVDAAVANKLANSLEAKVVIPVFYDKESLTTFLKEASAEGVEAVEKVVLKKKDMEGKSGEVIVLSA